MQQSNLGAPTLGTDPTMLGDKGSSAIWWQLVISPWVSSCNCTVLSSR